MPLAFDAVSRQLRQPRPGRNVKVFVQNTGSTPETINDATLAGYSLKTVIQMSRGSGRRRQHLLLLGHSAAGHPECGRAGVVQG